MSLTISKASLLPVPACLRLLAGTTTKFILGQLLRSPRFSNNAKFIYNCFTSESEWPRLYPTDILQQSLKESVLNHPYSLRLYNHYVNDENIYRIRRSESSDLLLFEYRKICDSPNEYRRRILCIIPDLYLDSVPVTLIWPPTDAEDSEVKVLTIPSATQFTAIIRTGIQSADLLGGDEW